MKTPQDLIDTYAHYQSQGHTVLAVTLSTYSNNTNLINSVAFKKLWDESFLSRVERYIPPSKRRSHYISDYVIEISTQGFAHFHGLIALKSDVAEKIWKNNTLNSNLDANLKSFRVKSKYRVTTINSFLIEPLAATELELTTRKTFGSKAIRDWILYMNKRRQLKVKFT